jgi:hypothetical protein
MVPNQTINEQPMTSAIRRIVVSFGNKATDTRVTRENLSWEDVIARFSVPVLADIRHDDFLARPKKARQELKTQDGYVLFGAFKGDQRGNRDIGDTLQYRSAVTLDFDDNATEMYASLVRKDKLLPFDYLCHTTRSHTPAAPRTRLIVPVCRDVSAAEYRQLASYIARTYFPQAGLDAGSLEHARIMYRPVQNAGAEFEFDFRQGAGFLNPDYCLAKIGPEPLTPGKTRREFASNDPTIDVMATKQPDPRWPLERVKNELLSCLDPNGEEWGRSRWLTVGMILHYQGDGDDAWLELWDDWSAHDERVNDDGVPMYQPGLCAKEWESFGRSHNVATIGTLIHWVQTSRGTSTHEHRAQHDHTETAGEVSRYRLLTAADLANAPQMRWLVHGVVPAEGLYAMYGAPGSGKSFLALGLSAAVVGDDPKWFGRRITRRPVTYCVLEGEVGMSKRIKAWARHHEKPLPDGLRFLTQPFDLLDAADVTELALAIQSAGGAGGMVVLDTLNRATPGADENSSVDMGNIIAAAKRLQRLIGGLVLLVHHSGKDASKGLRGHSSLHAALDGAIEVTCSDRMHQWRIAKSKDDESGIVEAFRLVVVALDNDEYGEPITSCVAVPDDSVGEVKQARKPRGANQKIAFDVVTAALRDSFDAGEAGAPQDRPCLRMDDAIAFVATRLPTREPKHKKQRAEEALKTLVANGFFDAKDGWLWRA